MTYKERFEELREHHGALEKRVLVAKANKQVSEREKKKIEEEIKKLLKAKETSPEKVEEYLLKLEKEIDTRLDILAEQVQKYEGVLSEFKSGEPKESNNILEDL